jgi:heme exporter protein C
MTDDKNYMHKSWWKIVSVILLVYTLFAGFLWEVPRLAALQETIRNLYFHVCMWFGMMILFTISLINTWADPNNPTFQSFSALAREPKLIGAAIALLIYFAYLVLRDSISDMDKRARISAVYNIFAYAMLFPSIWILPRVMDSLHPGREGNPALNQSDIDSQMRIVFYPAVIGWTLLGVWITTLKIRMRLIKEKKMIS